MVTGSFLSVETHGGSRRSLVSCVGSFSHTQLVTWGHFTAYVKKISTAIITNYFLYQHEGVGVSSRF